MRSAKYPGKDAERPKNWDEMAEGCSRLSGTGRFASVVLSSTEQVFDPVGEDGLPL